MLRYVIRRLLYAIPILATVSFLTILLFYGVFPPERIARNNLSAKNPTQKQLKDWLVQHGYDKPRGQQIVSQTWNLLTFQFGKSDANGEDIGERIRKSAVPSFAIALPVFFGLQIVTIAAALFLAYFRGTYVDYWGTFLCVLLMSIVSMVYIITGQFILGKILKIFPIAGYHGGLSGLKFFLMPTIIGILYSFGSLTRLYRTFMLEEMNQDYVRTARAKGVSEQAVLFRHVLKNAAVPIVTSSVAALPGLFLGSLLLESFFNIPGLGSYLLDAINSADFAVVRAMVFLGTLMTIIGYILTDIGYALVDPRVRLE